MFRNPRENPRGTVKQLPAVGRPPTPESSIPPPPFTSSSGSSPSNARPSTAFRRSSAAEKALGSSGSPKNMPPARSSSSFSSPARAKKSPAVNNATKAKAKPNQSILSFFKKVDPPPQKQSSSPGQSFADDDGDGLFVGTSIGTPPDVSLRSKSATPDVKFEDASGSPLEEQSSYFANGNGVLTPSENGPSTEGKARGEDNNARYNENSAPVKRRRLGGKFSLAGSENGQNAGESENEERQSRKLSTEQEPLQLQQTIADVDPATKACSPPPPDTEQQSTKNMVRSDRDARDGLEADTIDSRFSVALDNDDSDRNREEFYNNDEVDEDVPIKELDDNAHVLRDEPKPPKESEALVDDNGADTFSKGAPFLKREASSYFGEERFDDIEDFNDGDFGTGEEFEREYLEEQRLLELAEAEFNNEMDAVEGIGNNLGAEDTSPCCPVCSISMAGIGDTEASVHVNNCLDGNPTPLPERKPPPIAPPGLPENEPPGHARFQKPARPAKPPQENPFTFGLPGEKSSAFSKLMSGHAEDMAWASAAAAENADRGKPAYQRTCPFYKILPGFFICVDAFRYGSVEGCSAYFLSHFHSDHYIGLTANWQHGPIYCSTVTANLVKQQLRVDPKYVVGINFEEKIEVPGTKGVHVTMIPANHCPGSSLFLFEKVLGKRGKSLKMQRVLHCGDFRASPEHLKHPLLRPDTLDEITGKPIEQKIDVCYLDTTYLNPKYAFRGQNDVIGACADMCVSLNKERVDASDSWEQMKRDRAGSGMVKFVRSVSNLIKREPGEDDTSDSPSDSTCSANRTTSDPSRKMLSCPLNPSAPTVDAMSITPLPSNETNNNSLSAASEISPANPAKSRGRLLVVIGTYSIGKERICLGIARALQSKIYAPAGKLRVCACLEDPGLSSLLTPDPLAAQVHMTPLFEIRADTLQDYLNTYKPHFTRVVGFRPTGWNYRPPGTRFIESPTVSNVLYSNNWRSGYTMRDLVPQRGSTREAKCFGVPYSEHSSFRELTVFACALRIDRIIPTVNVGSAKSREKMKAWIERWALEKKKNGLYPGDGPNGDGPNDGVSADATQAPPGKSS
ncbi:DRMBL-domain-containing protein [Xylona heveae TC161]|uniref:DRMBL-domain-containing protein n=1 Tax=Xylona heveae (strain CBS 132557 / TC161) TaxID=1328760 RepID=A0A165HL61_XYLHT|nr:DRMBL-domain-containing protein [Xylona heveae TC161]KZF23680.1 DRMBL-domain-containing protein [Xylona heveae TC161]